MGPLPVSVSPFCSSSPMSSSVAWGEVGDFTLCGLDPFPSLFLPLLRADPAMVGLGICLFFEYILNEGQLLCFWRGRCGNETSEVDYSLSVLRNGLRIVFDCEPFIIALSLMVSPPPCTHRLWSSAKNSIKQFRFVLFLASCTHYREP